MYVMPMLFAENKRFLIPDSWFIHLTTRPSADDKRAPLTAISLQAVGSPKAHIYRKDVVTNKI